jgi:hypothetical protein
MKKTEDAVDIVCEMAAEKMVGMDFNTLLKQMEGKGYKGGRLIHNRKDGTSTVFITNGNHETRFQYKVTFGWKEKFPGMSEPDKVVACKWIRPLRPEPFEVR